MSKKRIQQRKQKIAHRRTAKKYSYGCSCNDPSCPLEQLGRICRAIGRDIPLVLPSQLLRQFGVGSREERDAFLREHFTSHDIGDVSSVVEELGKAAFVLGYLDPHDEMHIYELISLKPGHEEQVPLNPADYPSIGMSSLFTRGHMIADAIDQFSRGKFFESKERVISLSMKLPAAKLWEPVTEFYDTPHPLDWNILFKEYAELRSFMDARTREFLNLCRFNPADDTWDDPWTFVWGDRTSVSALLHVRDTGDCVTATMRKSDADGALLLAIAVLPEGRRDSHSEAKLRSALEPVGDQEVTSIAERVTMLNRDCKAGSIAVIRYFRDWRPGFQTEDIGDMELGVVRATLRFGQVRDGKRFYDDGQLLYRADGTLTQRLIQ
jgi:hypothetical protein